MKKLLIFGAGGFGKTVADLAAQLNRYDCIAFLDDSQTGENILGKCQDFAIFAGENTEFFAAFGNPIYRMKWLNAAMEQQCHIATLIHPRAYVSPVASIAPGSVVLPMAVVNTGVKVETGCIINCGAIVDHDCVIETGSHIAPGAVVKAENRIAAGSKIESGTVIQNREFPL